MLLHDLSLEEIEDCIKLLEQWFREDHEIEEERYDDKSYTTPEAFLNDMDEHRRQRLAMGKMLKVLEDERDRRKQHSDDPGSVRLGEEGLGGNGEGGATGSS